MTNNTAVSLNSFVYKSLLKEVEAGNRALVKSRFSPSEDLKGTIIGKRVISSEELNEEEKEILKSGRISFKNRGDELVLYEPHYPKSNLIIFGGGHIALTLAKLGSMMSFGVTVVDDREYFANKERFPECEMVICKEFEESFGDIEINSSSYIVIATRGHRHDLVCLKNIMGKNFKFLGMVGSKKRSDDIRAKLDELGFDRLEIEKLNAPIGMRIGAVTPPEIAISIMAQIIEAKRLENGVRCSYPEFDRKCHEALASGKYSGIALATILDTEGSVPREAGAKMLIYSDGTIEGSIGGGSGEAQIIQMAGEMVFEGYMIKTVDMTGQIAEDDGMVCGGRMKVLIEKF